MYTQSIMETAAAQTARLMITYQDDQDDQDAARAFALRRLAAVPDLEIFHVGGKQDWDIKLQSAQQTAGKVTVEIQGRLRPLPVLSAFANAWGKTDAEGNIVLKTQVSYEGQPRWVEGDYASWCTMWE